jgi:aldehyde dehydrogenase
MLAMVETIDNGKPIRETTAADMPLAIDHFRYFAACVRSQEGSLGEIDRHRRLSLSRAAGRGRPDHPVELPAADGRVEAGPALAAGNCVVLKPAEQTPMSILVLAELIADLLPGAQHRQRLWHRSGQAAGHQQAHRQDRLHRRDLHRPPDHAYASENLIPVTLELGGKSPNIFFADVMDADDDYFDKALEGFAMFGVQPGRSVHLPVARWCRIDL